MDTEGTVAAPFQGVDFIEYIIQYHKGKKQPPPGQNALILTFANLSNDQDPDHLQVGGTFNFAGREGGFQIDTATQWSSRNLRQFLNFYQCLYYQGGYTGTVYVPPTGPGAYITDFGTYYSTGWAWHPLYNFSMSATVTSLSRDGVPIPSAVGLDRSVLFFPLPGETFSASATGPGQMQIGWLVYAGGGLQVIGGDDGGAAYLNNGQPIWYFVPISSADGGASVTNMVTPSLDSIIDGMSTGALPFDPELPPALLPDGAPPP